MTLISTIIRDAYRESNLIPITSDPTADEMTEGLRLLNRYVLALIGNDAGDPLVSIPIGNHNISRPAGYPGYSGQPYSDWFAPVNARLILNLVDTQTVYLAPNPEDGARFAFFDGSNNLAIYPLIVNANGATIAGDTSQTFNTNGDNGEYFYRADTNDWALVSPLLSDSSSPFPSKFDDVLIVGLAMRLNPRNGVAANPQSIAAYKDNLRKFKAQYNQTIEVGSELGMVRTPGAKRQWRYYGDPQEFSYGYPRYWRR